MPAPPFDERPELYVGAAFAGGLVLGGLIRLWPVSPTSHDSSEKSLGEIVAEVSEKASLLVREEIELAKAEVITKAKTLGKGAAVAAAAGVFLVFALVMGLHALSWFWVDLFDFSQPWMGFGITTVLLVILGGRRRAEGEAVALHRASHAGRRDAGGSDHP